MEETSGARPQAPRDTTPRGNHANSPEAARLRAMRRREQFREQNSDSGFLVFIGVTVFAAVLGLVVFHLWQARRDRSRPVPIEFIFAGKVRPLDGGRVELTYDFSIDPEIGDVKEACPQLRDWKIAGPVESKGILVSAENRLRPFFDGSDISVACDAAIVTGRQIAIDLISINDNDQNCFYRFELWASRGPDWPAQARLVIYGDDQPVLGPVVDLPELRASANPTDFPTFYQVRFELEGGMLKGWFGPKGGELVKYCEMPATDLPAGVVMLRGPGSLTAFDNVVITGRPHPKCLSARAAWHNLLYPEGALLPGAIPESPPAPEAPLP